MVSIDEGWRRFGAISGDSEINEGHFIVPRTFYHLGKEKYCKFATDCERLLLPPRHRVTIKSTTLSRDVCQSPEDFANVILEGAEIDNLPEGSRGIWFHISPIKEHVNALKYTKVQTHEHYREKTKYLSEKDKKLAEKNLKWVATSPVFSDEFSQAYAFEEEEPKVRYHCDLNAMIASYKSALGISEVEFRMFGTVRYTFEFMYTVLMCPVDCYEVDIERFPLLETAILDVIKVRPKQQEDEVVYELEWRPYCTGGEDIIWDHVAFIFYIPRGNKSKGVPVPLPYHYQLHEGPRLRFNRKFSVLRIQKEGPNMLKPPLSLATPVAPPRPTRNPAMQRNVGGNATGEHDFQSGFPDTPPASPAGAESAQDGDLVRLQHEKKRLQQKKDHYERQKREVKIVHNGYISFPSAPDASSVSLGASAYPLMSHGDLVRLQREEKRLQQKFKHVEQKRVTNLPGHPSVRSVQYVLDDPKLQEMDIKKAVKRVGCHLAVVYFGEDILKKSSLTGRSGGALDKDILRIIKDHVRKKFADRIDDGECDEEDAEKWCYECIGVKCSNLKQKEKRETWGM